MGTPQGEKNMLKERAVVDPIDCWNVEMLYPNAEEWERAFNNAFGSTSGTRWPALAAYKGRLGESAELLKAALDQLMAIDRQLSKLYTYAHLRHDEDIVNDVFKSAHASITNILHEFSQEAAWFDPELLSLSDQRIAQYLEDPVLADYRFHIEKIVRLKKHTLTPDKEELMALAGPALQSAHKAFSSMNDADFVFGSVLNGAGEEKSLTHGLYSLYMRDQDRVLRKNAFTAYHQKYIDFENTMCELITGLVQKHRFNARGRNYQTCLDAALFAHNIDGSVYHALIEAVHAGISSLHSYAALRKKVLGVETLHLYDMYVPLIKQMEVNIPYKEAEELIIASVAPLGESYRNALQKGLQEQRWVDRYENKNKRSGAYSSGCFDSCPYILMNYKGLLKDAFTLAHEAGHSMHSLLTRSHQPYQYADYSIFVAEVASTFNEELLMQLLLERAKTKEEKIYLINQKVEDIRTTLFRQTMFAEFELRLHALVEKGTPLTPRLLKEEYRQLNAFYFGSEVCIDHEAEIEWARIPHFYYNFYVYQYATGISASLALAERVRQGGDAEREAYLSFLKGGSTKYPIEMLKMAGVDMRSPEPVKKAIAQFAQLVGELERLLDF